MTPKERAAMQQALGALENAPIEYDFHGNPMDVEFGQQLEKAITALREALAEQAEQEPVAWMNQINGFICKEKTRGYHVPLYAAPVRTKDLTEEEIEAIVDSVGAHEVGYWQHVFAHAVIAADREKNRG